MRLLPRRVLGSIRCFAPTRRAPDASPRSPLIGFAVAFGTGNGVVNESGAVVARITFELELSQHADKSDRLNVACSPAGLATTVVLILAKVPQRDCPFANARVEVRPVIASGKETACFSFLPAPRFGAR
jgi:hypothetical protein